MHKVLQMFRAHGIFCSINCSGCTSLLNLIITGFISDNSIPNMAKLHKHVAKLCSTDLQRCVL